MEVYNIEWQGESFQLLDHQVETIRQILVQFHNAVQSTIQNQHLAADVEIEDKPLSSREACETAFRLNNR